MKPAILALLTIQTACIRPGTSAVKAPVIQPSAELNGSEKSSLTESKGP